MRSISTFLWAIGLSIVLSACGGGGGGSSTSDNANANPSSRGAILSFSPSTLTASIETGTSASLTVRASVLDPSRFSSSVYVIVADNANVLSPGVELSRIDQTTFLATLHTSPSITVGHQTGSFQVKLCNDPNCTSEVNGSPIPLPYDLTVTPPPLKATVSNATAITVHRHEASAYQVGVSVVGPSEPWRATSSAPWLQVSGGTGKGAGAFTVSYATQGLAEGQYQGTITVTSDDGQSTTLPFSVEVLPAEFRIIGDIPTFTAINGAPLSGQVLSFDVNNGVPTDWMASTTASWLSLSDSAGTSPSRISLQLTPSANTLASGSYLAEIVLTAADIPAKSIVSQLTLIKPTLTTTTTAITLGGPKGRDLNVSQDVTIRLNTGANKWPYVLSGIPDWLTVTPTSGLINEAGITLTLTPVPGALTAGLQTATVTVTASVSGDTITLPLQVNVDADQQRVMPARWAAAITFLPTITSNIRPIRISDNNGKTLSWTATTDTPWLTTSNNGIDLYLSVDSESLPFNTLSYANITVKADKPHIAPAVIRVAVWRNATNPQEAFALPQAYTNVVADKLRPYVYAHNGGSTIDVFNIYTRQKVASIASGGHVLGQMDVAQDGARLYALDLTAQAISVFNLDTMTMEASSWPVLNTVQRTTSVLVTRTNGADLVALGDGTVYVKGRYVGTSGLSGPLAATQGGRSLSSTTARTSIDYSAMSGGTFFAGSTYALDSRTLGDPVDIAISQEMLSRGVVASSGGAQASSNGCVAMGLLAASYDGMLAMDAPPTNAEITANGSTLICGISNKTSDYDVRLYASSQDVGPRHALRLAGMGHELLPRQLVLSADDFLLIGLTTDPKLIFVPMSWTWPQSP